MQSRRNHPFAQLRDIFQHLIQTQPPSLAFTQPVTKVRTISKMKMKSTRMSHIIQLVVRISQQATRTGTTVAVQINKIPMSISQNLLKFDSGCKVYKIIETLIIKLNNTYACFNLLKLHTIFKFILYTIRNEMSYTTKELNLLVNIFEFIDHLTC